MGWVDGYQYDVPIFKVIVTLCNLRVI